MPVTVDLEKCVGSRDCLSACAFNAIEVQNGKAVIFENCVDCDACVRACPTHAIISSTAPAAGKGGLLIADFTDRSGIIAVAERAAKRAGTATASARVEPSDAGAAADALAAFVERSGSSIIVLPHAAAGSAIAACLAAKIGASLVSGCDDLALDDSGGIRATRLRYGGIVRVATRASAGRSVVTLVPRGANAFAAQTIETTGQGEKVGDAPAAPEQSARCVIGIAPDASADVQAAAGGAAQALNAIIVDPTAISGKNLSPELYVAIGVEGSTEHNAAVRGAGTIVALVETAASPIAQIADYLLVGNVSEHTRALLAALG